MAFQSIYVVSDNAAALNELCAGAKSLGGRVTAVMFGDQAAAEAAASCGADALLFCPMSETTVPEDYAAAIAAEVKKDESALVMLYNSIRGRCLAGKIGVALDTAVLSSVHEATVVDGEVQCSRTVYGGTAHRVERFTKPYGVITVSSGVFEAAEAPAAAPVSQIPGAAEAGIKRIALNPKKESGVNLVAAKRIVDVGRGLAKEEDLEMCRKLAEVIEAEVGCSRPVAENNKWMPKANYLGITGVQVKPDLLIALGVSGQIQHIGGIDKSKVIVAINKDSGALIFNNCDFGLVGDMYKIVPALIEKLS